MKDVRFTRDMAPHHTGERRIVPDEVAAKLESDGDVEDVKPFPDPAEVRQRRQAGSAPRRPAGTYQTKGSK